VTACGFLEQDRVVRHVTQLIASSIREKCYCAEDPSVILIHTTMSMFDTLDQESNWVHLWAAHVHRQLEWVDAVPVPPP
jgi:hypothetical protein